MSLTEVPSATHQTLTGSLKQLVLRGILAGFVAGILAGGVAYITGEQHIDAAIAIEEAQAADAEHDPGANAAESHHHEDSEPLVSRDGQRAGLFLATALSGAALGAIYGCALAATRSHTTLAAAALIATVGATGWFSVAAVPFLKYPANPPAVGDPDTITERTILWCAMVALGLAAAAAFAYAYNHVQRRSTSTVQPFLAATVVALAIVAAGYALAPTIDEVQSDFPASLLWQFRTSSVLTQLTLWSSLVGTYAVLTERASPRRPQ